MVAVAVEISKGIKTGMETSANKTSIAKIVPAIGLLKTAAIPEAAPHASKRIFSLLPNFMKPPIFEPMADPVITMGASNPAEPPNPIVSPLVSMCEYIFDFSIIPDLFTIEKMIPESPFSNFPLKNSRIIKIVRIIPASGEMIYIRDVLDQVIRWSDTA